jgi:hypothetical protein
MVEIVNPLSGGMNKMVIASVETVATIPAGNMTLVAADDTPPVSPFSGKAMVLADVGSFGRKIPAWVSIEDRVTIPVRAS